VEKTRSGPSPQLIRNDGEGGHGQCEHPCPIIKAGLATRSPVSAFPLEPLYGVRDVLRPHRSLTSYTALAGEAER